MSSSDNTLDLVKVLNLWFSTHNKVDSVPKIVVQVTVPSNFLKAVCTKNFLCTTITSTYLYLPQGRRERREAWKYHGRGRRSWQWTELSGEDALPDVQKCTGWTKVRYASKHIFL